MNRPEFPGDLVRPGFRGVGFLGYRMLLSHQKQREDSMGRRGYPPEFRQRVLDLVAAGRGVADVARDLGITDQTISSCPPHHRIAPCPKPPLTSAHQPPLPSPPPPS